MFLVTDENMGLCLYILVSKAVTKKTANNNTKFGGWEIGAIKLVLWDCYSMRRTLIDPRWKQYQYFWLEEFPYQNESN